ncbi:MAG: hypothetical protein WCL06_10075 [Bacteroidota bacterium]
MIKEKIKEQLLSVQEIITELKHSNRIIYPDISESLNVYRDLILNSLSGKKKIIMKKVIKPLLIDENNRIDAESALFLIDQLLLLLSGVK